MSKHTFEIEIKSLLSGPDEALALVEKMKANDKEFTELGSHRQLNHYFEQGNLENLFQRISPLIKNKKIQKRFKEIVVSAHTFSIRTRQADSRLLLVIKASIDDTSSDNGTARLELEIPITDITLEQLDKLILETGFQYQAKWSRERASYRYQGTNVSIDKNAGYGYLAEFERVIDNPAQADMTKEELRKMMRKLKVTELSQGRLGRMFTYYNEHWESYYGTEKVFDIK